jgi:hypothetical protein
MYKNPAGTVTIASIPLEAGTWLVTARLEASVSSNTYSLQAYLNNRVYRGTMAGGGGFSVADIISSSSPFTVTLSGLALADSAFTNATFRGLLKAYKLD